LKDQADELRRLVLQSYRHVRTADPPPMLVVLTGGKQGVGTTTLAVHLSSALAALGRRTILIDANLRRDDLARVCGLECDDHIAQVLSGRKDIHELLQRGPGGVQVLTGMRTGDRETACSAKVQRRFITQLRRLGRYADTVVIDGGYGGDEVTRRFWQAADRCVLVTTTDAVSLMDSYATVKTALAPDESRDVHVLVNQVAGAEQGRTLFQRLSQSCQRFLRRELRFAGEVPWASTLASHQTGVRRFDASPLFEQHALTLTRPPAEVHQYTGEFLPLKAA